MINVYLFFFPSPFHTFVGNTVIQKSHATILFSSARTSYAYKVSDMVMVLHLKHLIFFSGIVLLLLYKWRIVPTNMGKVLFPDIFLYLVTCICWQLKFTFFILDNLLMIVLKLTYLYQLLGRKILSWCIKTIENLVIMAFIVNWNNFV